MKRVISAVVTALAFAVIAEPDAELGQKHGGWMKLKGYGFIAAIDCRPQGKQADYNLGIEKVKDTFNPEIRSFNGRTFVLGNAVEQLKSSKANAAVFIVEDKTLPMTLTAAEERWTLINAAKIKEDSPDEAKFRKRLSLLFMRQCLRIIGSDATKSSECCLYPVFSPKDLDDVQSFDVAIGVYMAINESMPCFGIEGIEMGTYEDACELGIAKAPTNDVQKAIWEKVNNKKIDAKDPTARWKRDFEKK